MSQRELNQAKMEFEQKLREAYTEFNNILSDFEIESVEEQDIRDKVEQLRGEADEMRQSFMDSINKGYESISQMYKGGGQPQQKFPEEMNPIIQTLTQHPVLIPAVARYTQNLASKIGDTVKEILREEGVEIPNSQ